MPPSSQISPPSLYLQPPQLTVLPQWLSPYAQPPIQGYKQNLRKVWHTFIKLLLLFSLNRIAQTKIHKRGFNFHWLEWCNTAAKLLPWIPYSESFQQLNSLTHCGGTVLQCGFYHSISNAPLLFSSKDVQIETYIPHLHLRITFHLGQEAGIVSSSRKHTGT